MIEKLRKNKQKVVVFSVVMLAITFFCCGGLEVLTTVATNAMNFLETTFFNTEKEVKEVTFVSEGFEDNEPGDYKIIKSADWTDTDRATIEFALETNVMTSGNKKDVIFVIDTSGSMAGEKYDRVSRDYSELLGKLLTDPENTAALVIFSDESEVLSDFTNDKDLLIDKVTNLPIEGATNYYAALNSVEELLTDYEKKDNRDCVVVLLTDGYPTANNTNQIALFQVISEKYDFVKIQGVQYEMGVDITQQLIEVSHKQYSIDMDSLRNVLFDVTFEPYPYEKFELVDYIDNQYFYVESVEEINASIGTVELVEENGQQKIIWNVAAKDFLSGEKANLKINVVLKDEYKSENGFVSTNDRVETDVLINGIEKNIETDDTPVLKHGYTTIYDMNAPEGCTLEPVDEEIHYAFEVVDKKDYKPSCPGYIFNGWESDKTLKYIGDDYYIMPTFDVTFRATWTKFSIFKAMDGKIYERQTLYKAVKNEAEKNNGNALEYTGLGSENYENKVYYYTGDFKNNHVLFADYCWKIVRTTDTGGVKLIYDGIPNNGVCNNTGVASQLNETYVRFNGKDGSAANVGYMYNKRYTSSYTTLSNSDKAPATASILVGKTYTTNENGTYSLVDPITVTPEEWQQSHETYTGYYACTNEAQSTCSDMRRIVYTKTDRYFYHLIYVYGKKAEYIFDESTQKYVYKLVDPIVIDDLRSDMSQLNNYHFTCGNRSDECSSVRYIHHLRLSNDVIQFNYITLSGGKTIEEAIHEMLYADDVNETSSEIKTYIETWYAENMIDYTHYLEDTVYCNDRRIANYNGWSTNGDPVGRLLFYPNMYRDLTCENRNDRFTVGEDIGNGKLEYPVGLLTATETEMVGYGILGTDQYYWTMSPSLYSNSSSYIYTMSSDAELLLDNLAVTFKTIPIGVRPVISLKPEVSYITGNGSAERPYVINSRSLD